MNKTNIKLSKFDYADIGLLVLSMFTAYIGLVSCVRKGFYNGMLAALMTVWILCILMCALNLKKRILLLLFDCCIFVFLIGRIFIPAVRGEAWWTYYGIESNIFAVTAITISIISMEVGVLLTEMFYRLRENKTGEKLPVKKDHKELLIISRLILIVCMICYYYSEFSKLVWMNGKVYEEYYLSQPSFPFYISFPASCMPIFLCIVLALLPSKKETFMWLVLYIVSTFPMLKIGMRNSFVLSCIFAFVYYFLRDTIRKEGEKKWIGKKEKGLLLLAIPVLILGMGMINYLRASGDENNNVSLSATELAVDLVYKQGTTYMTVLQGYDYMDELPGNTDQKYMFGPIKEEILYNSIGKKIFKREDIGLGNSLKHAYKGHSFAHALSYVVLGKDYISGNGRGSSYIIESYVDFGYGGVIVVSLILGIMFSFMTHSFGKNWVITMCSLKILTTLMLLPRSETTTFLTFMVSYKFWVCVIGVFILSEMVKKVMDRRKVNN